MHVTLIVHINLLRQGGESNDAIEAGRRCIANFLNGVMLVVKMAQMQDDAAIAQTVAAIKAMVLRRNTLTIAACIRIVTIVSWGAKWWNALKIGMVSWRR